MTYTFDQINDSLASCTSYSLEVHIDDDDEQCYVLIDGCGDPDGDPFYDLDDVVDFITNNDQVDDYLNSLNNGGN